jgi:hypothetical protein
MASVGKAKAGHLLLRRPVMKWPTFARVLIASCAVLMMMLVSGSALHGQQATGLGLITAVDLATNTLVLETRTGSRELRVAPTAVIRGDHGAVLSVRDLEPGDAVSYHTASDTVTSLRVARQFWPIPNEW